MIIVDPTMEKNPYPTNMDFPPILKRGSPTTDLRAEPPLEMDHIMEEAVAYGNIMLGIASSRRETVGLV